MVALQRLVGHDHESCGVSLGGIGDQYPTHYTLGGQSQTGNQKLEKVSGVIKVATATVGLAAAIVAKDPGAIAKNAKLVLNASDV